MTTRLIQRHDQFFKRVLDQPGAAGALLRERLPPAIAARLSDDPPEKLSETFVSDALAEQRGDRLYRVTTVDAQPLLIHVLVEHKSAPDPDVAYQLFGYQVRILERWRELTPQLPPPAVVTLVVYHGSAPWRVPLSLAEYLSPDPELRPHLLNFRYTLVDLGPIPDRELSRSDNLRVGFLVLKHGAREGLDRELLLTLGRAALALGLNDFIVAMRYLIGEYDALTEPMVRDVLAELTPQQEEPLMSIMLEEYKAKWLTEGRQEGRKEGREEGREEGRNEGVTLALRQTLIKLISSRFGVVPQAAAEKIQTASKAELDQWIDALFQGETLDAALR